jgi:hypothetical protein
MTRIRPGRSVTKMRPSVATSTPQGTSSPSATGSTWAPPPACAESVQARTVESSLAVSSAGSIRGDEGGLPHPGRIARSRKPERVRPNGRGMARPWVIE